MSAQRVVEEKTCARHSDCTDVDHQFCHIVDETTRRALCVPCIECHGPADSIDGSCPSTCESIPTEQHERKEAEAFAAEKAALKASDGTVRVMTFNVANYHDHGNWVLRRRLIAEIIAHENVDIVSLQELRHDNDHPEEQNAQHKGMLKQLLAELAALNHHCDHRLSKSHYYDVEKDFWEGKAVLVCNPKWKIVEDYELSLKKPPESHDLNRRTAQLVEIATKTGGKKQHMGIVNVHQSYDKFEYNTNIKETLAHADTLWPQSRDIPVMIMGDVNVEEEDPALKQFGSRYMDVWHELHAEPKESGYTGPHISKRIDYMFLDQRYRSMLQGIKKAGTHPTDPSEGSVYPSDHFALITKLKF